VSGCRKNTTSCWKFQPILLLLKETNLLQRLTFFETTLSSSVQHIYYVISFILIILCKLDCFIHVERLLQCSFEQTNLLLCVGVSLFYWLSPMPHLTYSHLFTGTNVLEKTPKDLLHLAFRANILYVEEETSQCKHFHSSCCYLYCWSTFPFRSSSAFLLTTKVHTNKIFPFLYTTSESQVMLRFFFYIRSYFFLDRTSFYLRWNTRRHGFSFLPLGYFFFFCFKQISFMCLTFSSIGVPQCGRSPLFCYWALTGRYNHIFLSTLQSNSFKK
jgi:hypothetical protein